MDFIPETFHYYLAQTTPDPLLLSIESAEGIFLFDTSGNRYIDFVSGIGVTNIGHRHPLVVTAIREQTEKHLHVMVYGEFVQRVQNDFAKAIVSALPPSLNCCYFVNSGTEANEGALKLAKRFTGRTELIAFHRSYHGSTHGSLSVSGNEIKKNAFRPLLPGVRFLNFNHLEELEAITSRTACVIMETIQGDAGVRIPSVEFMMALRQRCSETGALLILDEIQCGMGRTGTLFGFEQFNVVPDILTIGKALGGGLPMGAFVADRTTMATLSNNPILGHITTFGGNPVCCAAGLASLNVLKNEKIIDGVNEKGAYLESLLDHPAIKAVRRIGLMIAVDFEEEAIVQKIVNAAIKEGLILFRFLSHPNSIRIAPPLTITREQIEEACGRFRKAITASQQ